jgi:hypothetical protein
MVGFGLLWIKEASLIKLNNTRQESMKSKLKCAALLAAGLSAGAASANTIQVHIVCPNGNSAAGIKVCATRSDGLGPFCGSTDSSGNILIGVPSVDHYNFCVEVATLPAGASIVGSACVEILTSASSEVDFTLSGPLCSTPPRCPDCVAPVYGLSSASGCTVLELGRANVSINGPPGGILGNICIASGGSLQMSGSEYIAGMVELGAGAKFQNSSSGVVGGVVNNVDLSSEIAAAYAANTANAALPCTQHFTTLDGKSVTAITGGHGLNVICVQDIVLNGTQILLTGPSDAQFIFNVTGKFVLTGGGLGPQIRVNASAGILPSAVLYNILGGGQDVAFSGGGGGVSCCAAIVDGTILAPYRKIALSPGLVNGEVISGLDISIVSGSSVRCPPCP